MKQILAELHTHTLHSDGRFTVSELIETARNDGLQLIALTDHNTASGWDELKAYDFPVIRGFEWTTYYGHMLVLGEHFADWRSAKPDNIDEKIQQIREAGGLVGIAHPFHPGSPFCTGCHWDFQLKDWSLPHYIEIWSGSDPHENIFNQKAYAFWISLLDKGIRIPISHGKDWHSKSEIRRLDAFTLLEIRDDPITPQAAIEAIRHGRTAVSLGPILNLQAFNGKAYSVGEVCKKGKVHVSVEVTLESTRSPITEHFSMKAEGVSLLSDGGRVLHTFDLLKGEKEAQLELKGGYVFAQVFGEINGRKSPLAISSPIYLEEAEKCETANGFRLH